MRLSLIAGLPPALLLAPSLAFAQNATTPGTLAVDPPTLGAVGFVWPITGDDNRNAQVSVEYRAEGSADFKPALPLFRPESRTFNWDNFNTPGNVLAGSVFDLAPDTNYEFRLTLTDPDGGNSENEY